MASVSHEIVIRAKDDAVLAAAAAVSHLDAKLIAASGAASAAASAVDAAAARVAELEKTYAKATAAVAKAAQKFGETDARTYELAHAAAAARDAAEQEAAALDRLTAEASAATEAHHQLTVAAQQVAAAERDAADAAAQARKDAEDDSAADAKLRQLETTYATAEAERHLADKLAFSTGLISEQAKAFKKAEKAAADAAKTQEKAANEANQAELKTRQNATNGIKKQTEHYKTLAKVALVAAAAAVAIGIAVFQAAKSAVLLADKTGRLDALSLRLQDHFKKMFGGLKIGKLLDQFEILGDLFHENTAAGRAMKFLFESLMQPLIDAIAAALPFIELVFITLLTWAVRAYIALVKFSRTDTFNTLITGLKVIGVIVGVSLGLFVAFIAIGIALFLGLAAAVVYLVGLLWGGLVAAWDGVKGAVASVVDWLSSIDLAQIGMDMITGLANGIMNAGGAILAAITGVVGGAIDAAKSLLGIASPSKVFAEIGGQTAEGMAGGIDDGAGEAQSAMSSMVEPPDAPGGAPGAGGGATITISGNTFILQGADGQAMADDFLAKLEVAFRGMAATMGGGEVPG